MSDASRQNLYAVLEDDYGVTPPLSPNFEYIRHLQSSPATEKGINTSEELHADRQIRDSRHGARSTVGDIGFELTYASFDTFLEAVFCGTWTADVLLAGVERRSFSILRHFTDQLPAAEPYHMFTGQEFNSFTLEIPADGLVTGSFGLIGKGQENFQDLSALTTPVFGTPNENSIFDAFTGTLLENGGALTIASSLSMSLENALATRFAIGSPETLRPSIGRSTMTGDLGLYFENSALLNKFLDETESSINITLVDPAGNQYIFSFPRIKYNGGPLDVSGEGAIPISLPIEMLYDVSDLSQVVITRIPV